MSKDALHLTKREREIMDAVYSLGRASVNQVVDAMKNPPSRTTIRTILNILETKGHLRHSIDGRDYVYAPTRPRQRVGLSALRGVLNTFFDGSLEQAVTAHFSERSTLKPAELRRLKQLIKSARSSEQ